MYLKSAILTGLLTLQLFAARSQRAVSPVYELAINNGMAEIIPGPGTAGVHGLPRAISMYVAGGARYLRDSLVLEASLRAGNERSRFEKEYAPEVYYFYHARNITLSLCLSAGLVLNHRNTLFGGLNIARIFASDEQGGGSRSGGYQYELTVNTTPQSWDFRPCLRWQYRPSDQGRMRFNFSIEPSTRRHRGELKDVYISSNFTERYYKITYNLIILSAGVAF